MQVAWNSEMLRLLQCIQIVGTGLRSAYASGCSQCISLTDLNLPQVTANFATDRQASDGLCEQCFHSHLVETPAPGPILEKIFFILITYISGAQPSVG